MYGKPAAFDIEEAGAGPAISTVPLAPACSSRRMSASDSDYEDALVKSPSHKTGMSMALCRRSHAPPQVMPACRLPCGE